MSDCGENVVGDKVEPTDKADESIRDLLAVEIVLVGGGTASMAFQ
jgi:hypothetical protein